MSRMKESIWHLLDVANDDVMDLLWEKLEAEVMSMFEGDYEDTVRFLLDHFSEYDKKVHKELAEYVVRGEPEKLKNYQLLNQIAEKYKEAFLEEKENDIRELNKQRGRIGYPEVDRLEDL